MHIEACLVAGANYTRQRHSCTGGSSLAHPEFLHDFFEASATWPHSLENLDVERIFDVQVTVHCDKLTFR